MNVEIPARGKLHKKIWQAIHHRWTKAVAVRDKRKDQWEKDEEAFRAYMPEKDVDAARRLDREQAGTPQYTTIMVPHSYSIAMTAHTYLTSVFLSRSPVWQFMGRHGEPEMQVQAVEAMMDYQTSIGQMIVPMFIWILDSLKYGAGIIGHSWEREEINVTTFEDVEEKYLGLIPTGNMKKVRRRKTGVGYEGNRIINIRPSDFIWDTRVALTHFQDGEFAGHEFSLSWNEIVVREQDGDFINVDELRRRKDGSRGDNHDFQVGDVDLPEGDDYETNRIPDYGSFKFQKLYIQLIPRQWGLGKGERPEIWIITLCEKQTIVECRPYEALHGKFPYSLLETEMDAYAMFKRSMMEINDPMQRTMDWLINTHMYNVRAVLNDKLIVDPSLVYTSDLRDPTPGKFVRLRPKAFARGVMRDAVQQLRTDTVTNQHLGDTQLINELAQRVTGVSDNLMGVVNQGGRKTATEIRGTNTFSTNRLKTIAEFQSAQGFAPAGQMMLQMSQQWMTEERKLRVAGDLLDPQTMGQFMDVSPEAIQGFYDFVPVDGTMPLDRFAQVNLWREILMGIQNMPQIAMQYDTAKIFAWMAQLGGLKNIHRFKLQSVDPLALAQANAAGNVVPIDGGGAGGTGTEASFGRTSEPGQLSGLGQTT